MRRASVLIGVAAAVFLTALVQTAGPDLVQTARVEKTVPSESTDYLGSESCRSCHEDQYASWKKSLHVQMTRPIDEARVLGNFAAGTRFEKYGRSYAMDTRDGRRFVRIGKDQFEVHYTLGARRFQGYLSRLPDGRIYVLPVFWHVETGQWIDFKEITPLPDEAHDFRQIWTCIICVAR